MRGADVSRTASVAGLRKTLRSKKLCSVRKVPASVPAFRRALSRVERERKPFVPWPNSSTRSILESRRRGAMSVASRSQA